RITLTEPIDMQAAVARRDTFAVRRVVRNGQFFCSSSGNWESDVVTSVGSYNVNNKYLLTGVTNAANIQVGSLVEGTGVGREIYVEKVNPSAQTVTLSHPLYGGNGTQQFKFTRFKYALDFIGFKDLSTFSLDNVEVHGNGVASAIMLPLAGVAFHVRDCFITAPADRGITSAGTGCQGLMIDRCNWISDEFDRPVPERTSIGFNANKNDVKLRDNRIIRFKHWGVLGGTGNIVVGNHYWHGDNTDNSVRKGGLVFAKPNVKSLITGNYIDNNFIEWTNEYEERPEFNNQFSFGGLTVTGNIFTVQAVQPWFSFIVIKPYGPGHYIQGMSVIGNVFKPINGTIDRIDTVDTTFADLNHTRHRNITFEANSFNNVKDGTFNPLRITFEKLGEATTWNIPLAPNLPFGGMARWVESIVPLGAITDSSGARSHAMPYTQVRQGTNQDQIKVNWDRPVKGEIQLVARVDKP
ncbi:MAG: right-handed parallel beta-helix repeat-containing protein, partial [Shimia sp.]